jgi:hypothetical protein
MEPDDNTQQVPEQLSFLGLPEAAVGPKQTLVLLRRRLETVIPL